MNDPVCCADGLSYERVAITAWLSHSHTSPVTNLPLDHVALTPNASLLSLINAFKNDHLTMNTSTNNNTNSQVNMSLQTLAKHFEGLDKFRTELETALDGWKPPVVVVFGQESCGKSTILERIAMVPLFPKGDDICTRLPILVQLRNTTTHENPTLHTMERNDDGADRVTGGPGPFTTSTNTNNNNDPTAIVQETMLNVIRRENSQENGISQRSYLRLQLSGPHLPNLDLLDLPGLVVNPASTEPTTMHEDTHALVDMTIEQTQGRAVYLAIREISEKARTSQAIKVLERHPNIVPSTLGVFTKCDEVRRKKVLAMMSEESLLRHGHIATMNAPPEEGEQTGLYAQSRREMNFFEEEGMAHLVSDGRATCNALVNKISDVYLAHLVITWLPHTNQLLISKRQRLTQEDTCMGLPHAHDGQLRVTQQPGTGNITPLPKTVAMAAATLISNSNGARQERVMQRVLLPFQEQLNTIVEQVVPRARTIACMSLFLPSENINGTFVDHLLAGMAVAARALVLDVPESMRQVLEQDVGARGTSRVRVGRFPLFIDAVVAAASVGLNEQIENIQGLIRVRGKALVQQHCSPVLNFPSQEMRFEVADQKKFVDAVLFAVMQEVHLSNNPTGTSSLDFEAIASTVDDWVENCAEDRVRVSEELQTLERLSSELKEVFDATEVQEIAAVETARRQVEEERMRQVAAEQERIRLAEERILADQRRLAEDARLRGTTVRFFFFNLFVEGLIVF